MGKENGRYAAGFVGRSRATASLSQDQRFES
jgi:hypothetical protein